jgi:hypothetical protein
MASSTVEDRKKRVEAVRSCVARLERVDAQILDLVARLPALAREVEAVNENLREAVAPLAEEG